MLKLLAGVIAVITAAGGYMSWKYDTTSACEAGAKAVRDEMPAIVDDLAERDVRFKALQVGGALFSDLDTVLRGVSSEMAAEQVKDKSAVTCAMMVVEREVSPASFRERVGDEMSAQLAERLRF